MSTHYADIQHPAAPRTPAPRRGRGPWPITCSEFVALVDLGLTDDRIAAYFGVGKTKVAALRTYYGLSENAA